MPTILQTATPLDRHDMLFILTPWQAHPNKPKHLSLLPPARRRLRIGVIGRRGEVRAGSAILRIVVIIGAISLAGCPTTSLLLPSRELSLLDQQRILSRTSTSFPRYSGILVDEGLHKPGEAADLCLRLSLGVF